LRKRYSYQKAKDLSQHLEKMSPLQRLARSHIHTSGLLLFCTALAIIWASLPATSESYQLLVELPLTFHFGHWSWHTTLRHLVNDGLLSVFFLLVGLEIKREFLLGELAHWRNSVLVIFAAFGGMILPPVIFCLLNGEPPALNGWAIPMATDTAFALGVLACFRHKLPAGFFPFIAALATLDDIAAILVIALFYSQSINILTLLLAALCYGLLLLFTRRNYHATSIYLFFGLLIWILVVMSGLHGTFAAVLIAMTIPASTKKTGDEFIKKATHLVKFFEHEKASSLKDSSIENDKLFHALESIKSLAGSMEPPLQRWGHALQLPTFLIVLPLFALMNAGFSLFDMVASFDFNNTVVIGIVLALVVGKPLGIISFVFFAIKTGIGRLPKGSTFAHLLGVVMLAGIGFTMSLFIAHLSYPGLPELMFSAKAAIQVGSLIAGILGSLVLIIWARKPVD